MNGFKDTHIKCPCGKSSDAYALNKDGSGKCFSCNKFFNSERKEINEQSSWRNRQGLLMDETINVSYKFFPTRGISEATLRFFDIKTEFNNNEPVKTGFKYPNNAIKFRSATEKKFWSQGPMKDPSLFGMDKFDPGSKDSITITEGEYDACAVHEITRGKTASVSVRSSSSAHADCVANFEYLNSFKKIILAFDNDEPGQNAAKQVSALFDFNKVYHVKFHKYKDANKYLEEGEADEFYKAWENARRYSPDNIISTFAEIKASLKVSKEDQIGTYPFEALQQATYGLHEGEVIVVKAPRGCGKTEFFRSLEHHLLKTTDHNIGIIHLEEDNATTIKAIAGYELGVPAVLPDSQLSEEDIIEGYSSAVKGNDQRVHIYSSFEIEDENIFLNNVRFLVAGAGCKFIFFDHITWLATGMEDSDERKKLDRLSQRLKLLAKELRFCLIMISHVNANGVTRGSQNIENVANTLISLSRDSLNPEIAIKNTTHFMLEKVRLGGHTGPAGHAYFDPLTNILRESFKQDLIKVPNL